MLDLEVPTQWEADDNVRRNQLRLSLHLNVAACGLRATDAFGETRYLDTISHASRVLEADPTNVKALFRRGQAHLYRSRGYRVSAPLTRVCAGPSRLGRAALVSVTFGLVAVM